jgi:glycosyltransferase involved in cell wall biosynthesis
LLRSYDLYWGTNHFIPAATTKPSILTVHDLLLLDYPWDQSWSQLWGRRFISALRRSKTILADSETTAHDLVAKFPSISSKTIVARLGFCQPILDLQVPNLQFSNPYLVMLGAHRPRKNMRLALDVVQSLARNGKRIQLVVTGDVHQSFQKEIEGLPEMVRAVGVLSKSELFWLMQNSIGLLFPSLYEGFWFPILEAMAVGCPVLALDTPINREIGGAAALLLPNQPEPWVKAIRRLEADAVFRSEIVCMGRENISRFSWDSTAAVYSQAIHHVLG